MPHRHAGWRGRGEGVTICLTNRFAFDKERVLYLALINLPIHSYQGHYFQRYSRYQPFPRELTTIEPGFSFLVFHDARPGWVTS